MPAVNVWERCRINIRSKRTEAIFIRFHFARHAHRQVRTSVIAALERNDSIPACIFSGHFNCILHRFRTGVEKDRLLIKAARRNFTQLFSQFDITVIHDAVESRMQKLIHLVFDRFRHFRVCMPHILHADCAREIDELVAFRVSDSSTVRMARDTQITIADAPCDIFISLLLQFLSSRHYL